jgi:hypothetical protein
VSEAETGRPLDDLSTQDVGVLPSDRFDREDSEV